MENIHYRQLLSLAENALSIVLTSNAGSIESYVKRVKTRLRELEMKQRIEEQNTFAFNFNKFRIKSMQCQINTILWISIEANRKRLFKWLQILFSMYSALK